MSTQSAIAFLRPLRWVYCVAWFTDEETIDELDNLLKVTHLQRCRERWIINSGSCEYMVCFGEVLPVPTHR